MPWARGRDDRGGQEPPPAVLAAAGVRPRAVMAAAAVGEGDRWAIATRDRLLVLSTDPHPDPASDVVLAWVDLDLADWDAEESRLVVVPSAPDGEPLTLPLTDAGDLLVVIRERLSATLVLERHARLDRGRQVTVVCRRRPSGGLVWRVRYSEGVDPDDPAVRRAAATLLERTRDEVGDPAGSPPA